MHTSSTKDRRLKFLADQNRDDDTNATTLNKLRRCTKISCASSMECDHLYYYYGAKVALFPMASALLEHIPLQLLDNEHTPRHNMAKTYLYPRIGGANYSLLSAQASLIRFGDRLSSGCPHAQNSSTESAPTLLERDCHVGT